MAASSESTVCLICFKISEKHNFVPSSDVSMKILNNCNTYLHSTLTKETLKDVQLKNENEIPLCKSCFDSALELTQLSQQLSTLQKEISDLSAEFSLTVFHRRSQVYNDGMQNNSQGLNKSSVIELNVSVLPSNICYTKYEAENMEQSYNINNQNFVIDDRPDSNTEITYMNYESSDFQFDDLPEDDQQTISNSSVDAEIINNISFNQPGLDNQTNLASQSKVRIIKTTGGENELLDSTNSNNVRQLTMSDLMNSVKMPQIKLERIHFSGLPVNASVANSCRKKSEPRPKLLKKIKHKDNDLTNSNYASRLIKMVRCVYCEKTFKNNHQRSIHHKTHTGGKCHRCPFCQKGFPSMWMMLRHERIHTGEKPHKCSFCERRFNQTESLKVHERTHTGEKPFKCSFCTKAFTCQSNKNVHERKIHTR